MENEAADFMKKCLPREDLAVTPEQLHAFLNALDGTETVIGQFGRQKLVDASSKRPDGTILLSEFVDWIFKSEAVSLPNKIGSAEEIRMFWSGHQTETLIEYRTKEWGPIICGEGYDENSLSIKASMPPFNNSENLLLPKTLVMYNVPNYGPNIGNAIMELFDSPEMRELSATMRAPIPQYTLNPFIQGKMPKVHHMIKEARKRDDYCGANKTAIDKVEEFTKALEALKQSDLTCPADWTRFVNKYATPGWEHRLHFDFLMSNFGYEDKSAKELGDTKFIDKDGKEVTISSQGYRWLSKAFTAYGPKGCLTDVVNLIFAMGKYIPVGEEKMITECIQDFHGKLKKNAFKELWVPTHFVHDAEADDMLCWLLLEYLHKLAGTSFEVLVQLPTDAEIDALSEIFQKSHARCKVYRDPKSRNLKQVMHTFPDVYPEM